MATTFRGPLARSEADTAQVTAERQGAETSHCVHCHSPLLGRSWADAQGMLYCCPGCRSVAQLLGDRRWEQYYQLLEVSCATAPRAETSRDYRRFLEELRDPDLNWARSHGKWRDGHHHILLHSPEITCSACAWLLESVLKSRPAVRGYRVDFVHGNLSLEYDADQDGLADILEELSRFGYTFRLHQDRHQAQVKRNRQIVLRLTVAGACFANIMSFALAGYFGWFSGMETRFHQYFGLLSLILSLPVVTYSAWPFYRQAWLGLLQQRVHLDLPVSLGIVIAFAASLWAFLEGGLNYFDSVAGLVFFLLAGRWGVQRFEGRLSLEERWFEDVKPEKVRLWNGRAVEIVPLATVELGDRLLIQPGEFVPLDGSLESPRSWIDKSILTGESRPVAAGEQEPLFAGYRILRHPVLLRVTARNSECRIDAIKSQMEQLTGNRPEQESSERIAPWFTAAVIGLAALAFLLHRQAGLASGLRAAAAMLIITCPCALALARPLSLGVALKAAARLGLYFRSSQALLRVNAIRCVLFDKTGTLTRSRRRLTDWNWVPHLEHGEQAYYANLIRITTSHSLHPVSRAISDSIADEGMAGIQVLEVEEVPHVGVRAMLTVQGLGQGPSVRKHEVFVGSSASLEPSGTNAGGVSVLLDGEPLARLRLEEQVSPDVPAMLGELNRLGLSTILVSGDHPDNVERFAKDVGMAEYHGGMSPEAKQQLAQKCSAERGELMAVGDGFNDSLLLATSSLAVVVKGAAQPVTDRSDILFLGKSFLAFAQVFALARGASKSIRLAYGVSLGYNAFAVALALAGKVGPLTAAVLMPLSSLSVCVVAFVFAGRHGKADVEGRGVLI